jgi:hypothetical protein
MKIVGMASLMLFASGLLIPEAGAQILSSYVREQVGTLPRGRFMVSFVSVNASIDTMFGPGGEQTSLSSNFNQSISFQRITSEDPVRGNQLAGLFLANGVNLSDQAGTMTGSIQGTVNGKIPVLGYGITDDIGVFVSVPVLTFNIRAGYEFQESASTQAFLGRLNANDQVSVAAEMTAALNTSLESKLYNADLAWDPNLNRSYLGDVQINVMKVFEGRKGGLRQAIQPGLVLPTATDQDIHDLYGLRAGERRWGISFKYALEQPLPARFQANLGISGTYLFDTVRARRIPLNADDQMNELVEQDARVSGGSRLQTQAQLRYSFPRWISLNAGMIHQKRFQETITGSTYSGSQYAIASDRTSSDLLSSYFSLDLNSIQSFLEGGFLFPAVAELGVGIPLSGRNAIAEPVIQLQGSMFF